MSISLRSGALVFLVFLPRMVTPRAGACDVAGSSSSNVKRSLQISGVSGADLLLTSGEKHRGTVQLVEQTTSPGSRQCANEEQGWCASTSHCVEWAGWSPDTTTSSAIPSTIVRATCTPGCDVNILGATEFEVSAKTNLKATLTIVAKDAAGQEREGTAELRFHDGASVLVGRHPQTTPQGVHDVFLRDQSFEWCTYVTGGSVSGITERPLDATAAGAVERVTPASGPAACTTFHAKAEGMAAITYLDGPSVQVAVVGERDIVAIDIVDGADWATSDAVTANDVLSDAAPVKAARADDQVRTCLGRLEARFKTANDRYGLLPRSALRQEGASIRADFAGRSVVIAGSSLCQ